MLHHPDELDAAIALHERGMRLRGVDPRVVERAARRRSLGGRGRRSGSGGGGGPGAPTIASVEPYIGGTISVDAPGAGAPYQWYRDGSPIGGETASTYTIVSDDEGTDTTVMDSAGVESNAIAQPTIPAGLVLAWEAWTATPDANTQLETCPDRTGNSNTGTCPAALTARPALAASASYNNQVVAAFAGTAGQTLARATFTQGAQAQPTEVYWVGDQSNVGGTRQQWDGGGAAARHIGYKLAGGFAIAGITTLGYGSLVTTPVIYGGRIDGANSALYEQDPATPVATGAGGTHTLNGLTVAGAYTGTPASQTFAGIWVAPSGGLSEIERRALFAYAYWRFKVGIAP